MSISPNGAGHFAGVASAGTTVTMDDRANINRATSANEFLFSFSTIQLVPYAPQ
jgi:hypothetical protein